MLNKQKLELINLIEDDSAKIINFTVSLIQAESPNPPGDTRKVSECIQNFLKKLRIPHKIVDPNKQMPNILSSFNCGRAGCHLVLNGHMDVFPVVENAKWKFQPWSGKLSEGRIFGRGAADMKSGLAALIFAFIYMHRIRHKLKGRITLTCVSDEETFGPWGARYLVEQNQELNGDCCLSAEPSGLNSIRCGEKGFLWLEFSVNTQGAHGAYPHKSASAIKISAEIITKLKTLSQIKGEMPKGIDDLLKKNPRILDESQGNGAEQVLRKVTVNIGRINGGIKVNMIPSDCVFEVDIRIPIGINVERIRCNIEKIISGYPMVSWRELNYSPSSWSDPDGSMVRFLRDNSQVVQGTKPEPIVSLGATDARLWRYLKIPSYCYGPDPRNIGSTDECVFTDELLTLTKIHTLSVYDYLSK
jgi:succinyl-diaminopimelate desuccinylase